MKIKHTVKYNVKGEAPFKGAIIHATKESKGISYRKPDSIITEIIHLGDDGVIFTGDWHKRGKQFIELITEIAKFPALKTMIYTNLTIEDFMFEMGLVFWNGTTSKKLKRKDVDIDKAMLRMIGATVLDNYLTNEFVDRYFIMAKFEGENRVYQMTRNDDEVVEEVL